MSPANLRAASSHFPLATRNSQLATRPAFTLIELLVVLAIIGLVVALGIPLFGVLTGAKSVEAGRNVVAATLGQARTIAVNQGRYAGVMFYVDPATERTAMSIVSVTSASNNPGNLEDADPYDKYKTFQPNVEYRAAGIDPASKLPIRGDRVIALTSDADATYRGELYSVTPTQYASEYLKYLGNYRPTVRPFRCTQFLADSTNEEGATANGIAFGEKGIRPPRNGPHGGYPGSKNVPNLYPRPGTGSGAPVSAADVESTVGPFANTYWDYDSQKDITRDETSTSEQTLLPNGVALQVIVQPTPVPTGSGLSPERYLRTAVIMFDPQGRLVVRNFALDKDDVLGQYVQLTDNARNVYSGVGLVLYDQATYDTLDHREADGAYLNVPNNAATIIAPTNGALTDFAGAAQETAEELWLDSNASPLLINRYTGSLSEAE